jgi:hypothetical protein
MVIDGVFLLGFRSLYFTLLSAAILVLKDREKMGRGRRREGGRGNGEETYRCVHACTKLGFEGLTAGDREV